MLRAVLLALTVLLAAPASGSAMTMSDLTADVTIHPAVCPFYEDGRSCAQPESREVWIEPGANRFTVRHELRHVWEHDHLLASDRAWFTEQFGFPAGTAWFSDEDESSPGEMYATAAALCDMRWRPRRVARASGLTVGSWVDSYGYAPSPLKHLRICNAVSVLDYLR